MKTPLFKSEADLCAAFLAWVVKHHPEVKVYAEWAGWDILLVLPDGWQLGIQAKLRLNADVILQAAPGHFDFDLAGPDFRAVLVPDRNGLSAVAWRLGLVVFHAREGYGREATTFLPDLARGSWGDDHRVDWLDWNPGRRHELPPTQTDSIAGSSAPVSLTPWKLGALDVLAELAIKGTITTKRIRELGINPARWLTGLWLVNGDKRGEWVRGDRCPKFDEQHPSAYRLALEKATRA